MDVVKDISQGDKVQTHDRLGNSPGDAPTDHDEHNPHDPQP